MRRRFSLVPPTLLGMVIFVAWQLTTQTGLISSFLLPAPADVWSAFWQALLDGTLLSSTTTTLMECLLGSLLGATVALPLGYALARSQLVADFLQPYLAASQALPAVALAPLIAIWFGYGLISVIVLCALLVFFPIVVTTTLGLRLLEHEVLDAARVDGASSWKLLRAIELPLSITGAVVGEFVVGGKGLGELLLIDRSYADTAAVFADVLVLAALAIACYSLARWVERNYSYAEEA
jgi:NitT/TauT family transport system permease protein